MEYDILEKNNEDWDFDFSGFEEEKEEDIELEGFFDKEEPIVKGLRSKFSPGEEEIKQISQIKGMIREASIKVESKKVDMTFLWKYYGLLSEYWEGFKNICGGSIITDIEKKKKECLDELNKANETNKVKDELLNCLLKLRAMLYKISQYKHLGFEVERSRNSQNDKAKSSITQ